MPHYTHVLLSTSSNPVYRQTVKNDEDRRVVVVHGGARLTIEQARTLLIANPDRFIQLKNITEEDGSVHWFTPRKIFALLGFCTECRELKLPCSHCGGPHRCKQPSPATTQ